MMRLALSLLFLIASLVGLPARADLSRPPDQGEELRALTPVGLGGLALTAIFAVGGGLMILRSSKRDGQLGAGVTAEPQLSSTENAKESSEIPPS